jgi:hypothetical protein
MAKRCAKALLVAIWFAAWIGFARLVDDCQILRSWKPRYGAAHNSHCAKEQAAGFVWARSRRGRFQQ